MAQTQKLQKVTEELAEMTSKLASFQEQSAKEKAELTEQIAIYEGRLKSEGEARAQDMESEMKKFEMARESAEVIKVELTSAIADKKKHLKKLRQKASRSSKLNWQSRNFLRKRNCKTRPKSVSSNWRNFGQLWKRPKHLGKKSSKKCERITALHWRKSLL